LERAGHSARDIHGDLDQSQRTQSLDALKDGNVDFLVATDVAARGIDVAMLPCVINYDVPTHAEDYVHRIGRTGRAGQAGRAFTLAFGEEGKFVDAIAKLTGKTIPMLDIAGGGDEKPEKKAAADKKKPSSSSAGPGGADEKKSQGRRRRSSKTEADGKSSSNCEPANDDRSLVSGGRPGLRPASRSKPSRSRQRETENPVVGMGDHVPLFMQRPVPIQRASAQRKAGEG
jgi:superfamily II DNA/RNA helicase